MKYLLSLFVLVTIVSCTKFGKNVYVDGRVYNPITNQGVSGISVKLYRNKIDSKDPLGSDSKTLKTVTTDENGYYKMEHLASPFNQAFVQVNYAGYYPVGWVDNWSLGSSGIKKGKRNHLDYQMVPFSRSILKISNINCQGINDTIILNIDNEIHSVDSSYDWILTGCANWQTNGFSQIPSGHYYYHWRVIRNGVSTDYYDTIFYPENQLVTYEINY